MVNRLLSGYLLIGAALFLQTGVVFSSLTVINRDMLKASSLYSEGKINDAIAVYTLSAYQGLATSQYNLAVIYSTREGEINKKEFEFWLAKAAESGDLDAQFNLGMWFYQEQDQLGRLQKTLKWLDAAAQAGNVKAQYNLGYLSLSNLEIDITKQQGVAWLQKAARAGNKKAINLIKQLQKNKVDNPPPIYPVSFKIKVGERSRRYVIKQDNANVYAFPVGQLTPIVSLKKDAFVDVVEVKDDWLGIQLENGFPVWVPESQLTIESGVARASMVEAGLYLEPGVIEQSFKIGSVDRLVALSVIGYEPDWVKVTAPHYFRLWIREIDVVEKHIKDIDVVEISNQGTTDVASIIASNFSTSDKNANAVSPSIGKQTPSSPGKVTLARLHSVYEKASRESQLLGIVRRGTKVSIQDVSGKFSHISWESGGIQAWVFGKFFDVSGDFGTVITNAVRLRTLPDTSGNTTIIRKANQGEKFEVVEFEDGWYRIVVSSKNEGWIENL